jgi:hypothetical protein
MQLIAPVAEIGVKLTIDGWRNKKVVASQRRI